jgi:hypothetical protein
MNTDDMAMLLKMLKANSIPEDVEAEYRKSSLFLHRAGGTGLGALGLIDLLRYCGYEPSEEDLVVQTKIGKIKPDAEIEVALPTGPRTGKFKGLIGSSLAIELADDEGKLGVREVPYSMVRPKEEE